MAQMTAEQAATRLGVKRETLYAYVSRGILISRRSPDGRTSTFDEAQVEELARRGRPRRSSHEPVIDVTVHSALTRIDRGRVTFRGLDAAALAGTAAFEQVAELLWYGDLDGFHAWTRPAAGEPSPEGAMFDRLRAAVSAAALTAPSSERRGDPASMTSACRSIVAAMVAAVGEPHHDRTPRLQLGGDAPHSLRDTTAARLAVRLCSSRPGPELVAAINAALVLLTDHELAVSTLAARVAASARADAYGVIGAGLGPASGPLHGTASRLARTMLDQAERVGAVSATRAAIRSKQLPGFGHLIYRDGDPRAVALLARVRALPAAPRRLRTVEDVLAIVADSVGVAPNIDFALAALGHVAGMPDDAGEALFVIPRTAGWIAHGIEELDERPLRYRTRAVPR